MLVADPLILSGATLPQSSGSYCTDKRPFLFWEFRIVTDHLLT